MNLLRRLPERIWLLGILILAAALRLYHLGHEGLWLDEFVTWYCVSGDLARALAAEVTNPPLYYLIVHPWVQVAGGSEWALRFPSVPASIGTVALTYYLGRRLLNGKIGLMAALYTAISGFHIYYAQEARAHAWLVLTLLVTTVVLLNAIERGAGWLIPYTVLATASLYMHFMATFFLAAHGIYVIWLWWQQKKVSGSFFVRYCAAGVVTTILFAPWLAQMLVSAAAGGQRRRYFFLKAPQAYFSFLFGDTLIPLDERAVVDLRGTLLENAAVLAPAVLATMVLAYFVWLAIRQWGERLTLPLVMAVVPVVLCLGVSMKVMVFDERYMQTCSPFLYLLIAAGIARMAETPGSAARLGWAAVGVYAILGLISLDHYYFNDRYGKEQWREMVPVVEANSDPAKDFLLYEPDYLNHCVNYYRKKSIPSRRVFPAFTELVKQGDAATIAELRGYRKLWLIRSHYSNDELLDALRKRFPEMRRLIFPNGKMIEVYEFAPGT